MTDLNAWLRDLIDIPERVTAADFVIKLDEGVSRHEETLRQYVVTESIAAAIEEGLDLVAASLQGQSSQGAFLDGSFGSGKSHYMAVMHLLLSGNLAARQIPGLEHVIAARTATLDARLLVLDFNLLGARSFEDAIFGGYLKYVAEHHGDVPAPMLHASDGLIENAQTLRRRFGDEEFFAQLGGASAEWGKLDKNWDPASFDSAVAKSPGHPDRTRLINALRDTFFAGAVRASAWLSMADGLEALSAHAKSLGYQGIVFLIDEVVLWLGQHLGDHDWVQREIEKVVQLGENAAANLPIPITSFLARQRALSDFLGSHVAGAQRVAQGQLFTYWEDRFAKITLAAADLPKIVKQRLLRPRSSEAQATLDMAMAEIKRDYAAWGYLLSDEANSDEQAFANVYPFSPALVDAMVALSSLMQRERTALKLMAELLTAGRQTLRARDVIPVGDLYAPVVLSGAQPLTEEMKRHFAVSARFYQGKMRPYLLRKHSLTEDEAADLARNHPFVTEDRLVKTVLIAALAPEAKSLTNLTAAKLAALNWGTIDAFIPGSEALDVLTRAKEWASEFGEINVGEGSDPIISATPSGVDYDSILDRVRTEDNQQARRELIRKLIAEELNLPPDNFVGRTLDHVWRGRKRSVNIKFGNVRDDSDVFDSDLVHNDDEWRVIIDFPYDTGDHSPADDVARIRSLRDSGRFANTIAWIPNFLSEGRQKDLGDLVILEYLLTGNRFDQNSDHLPVSDRAPARQTLDSRHRTLRDVLIAALRQAYGVNTPDEANVGTDLAGNEIFATLNDGLTIPPPATGTLLTGLRHALEVAWTHEFPNHPDLGTDEVRPTRLAEAVALATQTIEQGGRRQGLSATEQRLAREVIAPLGIGTVNENVLVVDAVNFKWFSDLARWVSEIGTGCTVGELRRKLAPWGMTTAMQDAILIVWATLDSRDFGGGAMPQVGNIPDAATPRPANLPNAADWQVAQQRAGYLFGIPQEATLTPRAVNRWANSVRAQVTNSFSGQLVAALEAHSTTLGIDPASPVGRLATARRIAELVQSLAATKDDVILIEKLAAFDLPESIAAHGKSHATAERLTQALNGLDWTMLAAAHAKGDQQFAACMAALQEAAQLDESVVELTPRLHEAASMARQLVLQAAPATPPAAPAAPRAQLARTHRAAVAELATVLRTIETEIHSEAPADSTITISWQVDES